MIFNQSGGSASPTLQTKTVSPSTSSQLIVPDAGFDALSQVTVNAAPLQAKTATIGSSQTIIKPDSGQYGLSQVTVPAAALQSKTVTPSTSYQTITPSSGYYGLSSVGVSAVALQSKTVEPSKETQIVTPDSGYQGLSAVTIGGILGIPRNFIYASSISLTKQGSCQVFKVTLSSPIPESGASHFRGFTGMLGVVDENNDEDFIFFGPELFCEAVDSNYNVAALQVFGQRGEGSYQKMFMYVLNSRTEILIYQAEYSTREGYISPRAEFQFQGLFTITSVKQDIDLDNSYASGEQVVGVSPFGAITDYSKN